MRSPAQLTVPRMLLRYIATALGCEPQVPEINDVLRPLIEDDFTGYVRSVLDRERIDLVVLDLLGDLREAAAGFPGDRYI